MSMRNFLAQVMSALANDNSFNAADEVMFPEAGHPMGRAFLDVDARTGSMVDMDTPAGAELGTMGLGPVETAFCAGLDRNKDEDQ
jgi:hypothetical protein